MPEHHLRLRVSKRWANRTDDQALTPALSELLQALERHGHRRDAHEPLERYAIRLGTDPALAPSAHARLHYSAHRYGGHGTPQKVDHELPLAARALVGSP